MKKNVLIVGGKGIPMNNEQLNASAVISPFTQEHIFELKRYVHDLYDNRKGIPFKRDKPKVGRNEICPCGSNKKYINCCINLTEEK